MNISEKLKKLEIISGKSICEQFDNLYQDILDTPLTSNSKFIANFWTRYSPITPSLNGAVFEGLLATLFYRLGIKPIYVQAKLAFVPNVDFDFVIYTKEYGPIILSAKTSLRERYKQADLEGMMVRQVHRRAKSYLITLNEKEAIGVNNKIASGQVLGIDKVILATSSDFDELVTELMGLTLIQPEKIEILTGSRLIL